MLKQDKPDHEIELDLVRQSLEDCTPPGLLLSDQSLAAETKKCKNLRNKIKIFIMIQAPNNGKRLHFL